MTTPTKSLQQLVDEVPDLVEYFYNDTRAPHSRANGSLSAPFIPHEFTNWRDEQRSWRETAVLFDQSHHMPELFLSGPGAFALLERIGINSLANLTEDRAKQFVACNSAGQVIGDCVLYRLGEQSFELVSGMTLLDWVEYQAIEGGDDVTIVRDHSSPFNPNGRRINYRFQLDGPLAGAIFDEVVEGGVPEIPFFRTARVRIAGCEVLMLRHGMAGHKGAEISGPFDEMDTVRDAILAAGEKHGLVRAGTRTYFSSIYESGWMAYPIPAIYTGDEFRGFREWLDADSWEGRTSLAGSYYAPSIEDYYVNPWNLGYGGILKFDHDFIGREALERLAQEPQRQRVTLVWNRDDVARVYSSQFGAGPRFKSIEFPLGDYGFPQADEVRTSAGRFAGISSHCGYSNNEGDVLSLAMIEPDLAEPGTELTLTWGEPGGGSRKPHVERHEQTEIRVTVAPAPYAAAVQRMKKATISA